VLSDADPAVGPGRRITLGACDAAGSTPARSTRWAATQAPAPAQPGQVWLTEALTGLRATVPTAPGESVPGPFLQSTVSPAAPPDPDGCDVFVFRGGRLESACRRLAAPGMFPDASPALPVCVTAAEPNRVTRAALAVAVASGGAASGAAAAPDGASATFNVTLTLGMPLSLVVTFARAIDGVDSAAAAPVADATARAAAADVPALAALHAAYWAAAWNRSWVDLGPRFVALESVYYGLHYMGIAQSRGRVAEFPALPTKLPAGLWGPWITTDTPGWNGDYTSDYNFQAQWFSSASDNRVESLLAFFDVCDRSANVSRWRAGRPQPHPALNVSRVDTDEWLPGLYVAEEEWPAGVAAGPWQGLEQVSHLTPWPEVYFQSDWAIRWVGALSAKLYCDYFEFTQDLSFLADRAYPWVRDVAAFYRSYATRAADGIHYNLLYTCAQEGCSAQGAFSSPAASHNSATDLGFARQMALRAARYSALLGVDADLRAGWLDLAANLVPYPLTHDPDTGAVVLSQVNGTGNGTTDAFPSAGGDPGNARYPITYLGPIHPAEDVSLSSDAGLVEIARTTVEAVNQVNRWISTNGLCLSWPPASRVSRDANATLGHFQAAMLLPGILQRNLWPFIHDEPNAGSGCPAEQLGGMVAINDLYITGHEEVPGDAVQPPRRFLRLFPAGWPSDSDGAFATLRTHGAFLATGAAVGGLPQPLLLASLAGVEAVLLNAWPGAGAVCVQGRPAGGGAVQ
jgi:hypothetical protein